MPARRACILLALIGGACAKSYGASVEANDAGTASDAVCVVCPASGPVQPFGGPRSELGAPLARAVCEAVRGGIS